MAHPEHAERLGAPAGRAPELPHGILPADTIAADIHALQHSMRQMERSDAEMRQMVRAPHDHGLDEDDVRELATALEENVGVMERKRLLLAKLTAALHQALSSSGLLLDPSTPHAEPSSPQVPVPGAAVPDAQSLPLQDADAMAIDAPPPPLLQQGDHRIGDHVPDHAPDHEGLYL